MIQGCACLRPSVAISPRPRHPDPRLLRPRRRCPVGTRDAACLTRGLLLLRAVNRNSCSTTLRLPVCNPLADGTRDLLHPLEWFRVLYYALVLVGADFRSSKGLYYKVILVGFSCGDIKKYTILTFTSGGDPSWSAPRSCFVNLAGASGVC
jgi:hypothetical protein